MEDLSGKRFGSLTAIRTEYVYLKTRRKIAWFCECDCGSTATVYATHLRGGSTLSCGDGLHRKGAKAIDIAGRKFGLLTAVAPTGDVKRARIQWLCSCQCGGEKISDVTSLRSGKVTTCGCRPSNKTHGHTWEGGRSPTYRNWQNMVARCYYPSNPSHEHYKKLGITVCDRWRKFENFLQDMGERPSPKATVERIENAGNYEPNNCRWATMQEQGNNRSTNIHFEWRGATYTLADLARASGVAKETLRARLVRPGGWSVDDAIDTPVIPPALRRAGLSKRT